MPSTVLLAQSRLTIVTAQADYELGRIREIVEHKLTVEGRGDLEAVLGQLLGLTHGRVATPKTLDLVGHSTPGTSVLQLGNWTIDSARPGVTAFFRELADHDVLPRLGIYAVRLLGCRTAETAHGRRTIVALSDILGLEVYGTTGLIFANQYNGAGFDPAWRFLLVGSSDLRRQSAPSSDVSVPTSARCLDVDSLPAAPIDSSRPWPCRIADGYTSRAILRLIRRDEGASMPGLLALPRCDVLIPANVAGTYHQLQLVLDGDFVRVYPDGPSKPGILYPVSDSHLLRILVDKLPLQSTQASLYSEATQRTPMW